MIGSLIGIIASSGGAAAGGDYESIATVTVGSGGTSSITFSSIPSSYKHLQIRFTGGANTSSNYAQNAWVRLNGDTGTNYARHNLIGYSGGVSGASVGSDTGQTFMLLAGGFNSGNWNSSTRGAGIIDILDYTDTNKNTTVRALNGSESNDASTLVSVVALSSGLWLNTAAITSITILVASSTWLITENSRFALYGIKG